MLVWNSTTGVLLWGHINTKFQQKTWFYKSNQAEETLFCQTLEFEGDWGMRSILNSRVKTENFAWRLEWNLITTAYFEVMQHNEFLPQNLH